MKNNLITTPMRMFSYNALTRNYITRRAMNNLIIEINKKEAYRKLPIHTKFIRAFTEKKRRFGYLVILWLLYFYDCYNRTRKWMITKRYKIKKKYYYRWMYRHNSERVPQKSALDNLIMPKKLTKENYFKLGNAFIQVDNMLLYGVSRQLIINTLTKMEKMDPKLASKFLKDSGYKRARARTLHSCDLLEMANLLETILERTKNDKTDQQNQDELIEAFITQLPKEVKTFEENIEDVIKEMEEKGQEDKSTGGLIF